MSGRSPYTPYGGANNSSSSYYERTSLRRSRAFEEEPQQQQQQNHHFSTRGNNQGWKAIQEAGRNSSTRVFTASINQQVVAAPTSSSSSSFTAPTSNTTTTTTVAATSSSSSSSLFSGTIVSALTPFDVSGAVDLRVISEYAASIKQDGAKGVLIGTPCAGEGLTLSTSEQEALISAWCQHRAQLPVGVFINAGGPAGAALVQAAQRSGASCVVIGSSNSEDASATDAARFVASTVNTNRGGMMPFLVAVPSSLVGCAAEEFISAVSRLDGFRGVVVSRLSHVVVAANTGKCSGGLIFSALNADDDLQCISAAAEGATGFISEHGSVVAPLLNRIFAAGAKGDAATVTKMGKLFAQYIAGFPGRRSLQVSALKTLLALRLDLNSIDVRPPTPTLSAGDATRLRQRMEQFVKAYTSAIGGSAAPSAAAPSAAKTPTIDVMSMPGYRGQLNDLIIRRIEACERLCGKHSMIDKFPHLQFPDGRWRTRRAGPTPAQYIDHTLLKPEAKEEEVVKLVNEAKANNFFAVCVNGSRAARCVELCRGTGVNVAAVIGFPLGAGTIRAKAEEAGELVHEVGCREIDMVMNIGAFKDKNYRHVYEDIKAVVKASAPAIVKVIFETCLLSQEEIIDASVLSVFAGAQFIKTSTGFNKGGATPDAIDVMLAVAGNESDVKASGGVRDFASAMAYINAGVMRIGTSSGIAIIAGKPAGSGY